MNRPADCIRCLVSSRVTDAVRLGIGKEGIALLLEFIANTLRKDCDRTSVFVESFELIKKMLGTEDPYSATKRKLRELARRVVSHLNIEFKKLEHAELLGIAAASNMFDTQVLGYVFDEAKLAGKALLEKPIVKSEERLERFEECKRIAYILDNEGESVIDSLVVNELVSRGFKVIAVVRSTAYEIDTTVKDIEGLGIKARITGTGSSYPPTYDKHWMKTLANTEGVDLVIAKGIANLEGYIDSQHNTGIPHLFLLRAKCPVLAKVLGVPVGSPVIVDDAVVEYTEKVLCRT